MMTNNEAIARIKNHMVIHKNKEPRAIYITEALEMAIKALEQEPCEDTISRQAVLDALDKSKYSNTFCKEHNIDWSINLGMAHIVVNELKPITPQQIGHWVLYRDHKNMTDYPQCDNCGVIIKLPLPIDNLNFCPNCGRKMEGKHDNTCL